MNTPYSVRHLYSGHPHVNRESCLAYSSLVVVLSLIVFLCIALEFHSMHMQFDTQPAYCGGPLCRFEPHPPLRSMQSRYQPPQASHTPVHFGSPLKALLCAIVPKVPPGLKPGRMVGLTFDSLFSGVPAYCKMSEQLLQIHCQLFYLLTVGEQVLYSVLLAGKGSP